MELRSMSCMSLSVTNAEVLPNEVPVTVWVVTTKNGFGGVCSKGVRLGEQQVERTEGDLRLS